MNDKTVCLFRYDGLLYFYWQQVWVSATRVMSSNGGLHKNFSSASSFKASVGPQFRSLTRHIDNWHCTTTISISQIIKNTPLVVINKLHVAANISRVDDLSSSFRLNKCIWEEKCNTSKGVSWSFSVLLKRFLLANALMQPIDKFGVNSCCYVKMHK